MFISALFTIAKPWKQPKCPLTEEWIRMIWYIHTMEYYSASKKNKIMSVVATWLQLEIIILSEVSQKDKDKYYLYVESKKKKKMIQMNLLKKQKQTHRLQKHQKGKVDEE